MFRFPQDAGGDQDAKPFEALVLYYDEPTRKQAEAMFSRLAGGVLNNLNFRKHWYAVDEFAQDAGKRETALAQANKASAVVFSVPLDFNFPPEVREWMGQWTPHKGVQDSALILLGHPEDAAGKAEGAAYELCQKAARRTGKAFFCRELEEEKPPHLPASPEDLTHVELPETDPARHPGGLNE